MCPPESRLDLLVGKLRGQGGVSRTSGKMQPKRTDRADDSTIEGPSCGRNWREIKGKKTAKGEK